VRQCTRCTSPGGTCYILLDYILSGWDFFHFTGTGTVRWRAEGAALGSQSELSPELMSPSRIRRRRRRSWLAKKRFFYLCLCPHNYWGGGVEEDWAGRAARGCPTPEPFHTTKICTTGMLFTPKAFQGSEKSTVDLSFSLLTK